jgi:hypothetical protein
MITGSNLRATNAQLQQNYDAAINIILNLGYIPTTVIDEMCQTARTLINRSLKIADGDRRSRIDNRTAELWGGINEERQIFRSLWYDYEEEHADNFEAD